MAPASKVAAHPGRAVFAPQALGARVRAWRPSVLQWALGVSLLFHAALLAVRFADPQDFNRVFQDTPLEVVLVNARSQEAPTKAQAIAQARLAGGGEAAKGLSMSPLPPSPTIATGDAEAETRKQMEQLMQEQEQLLEATRRALSLMPVADPRKSSLTPQERQQEEKRQQLLRQFAVVEKEINEENARPRRRYISPATREEVYALYLDTLRQRIEERGTRNFPTANGRKLFGTLIVNVAVAASGKVLEAKVMQSSGSRALDQRAAEIARSAGPFAPFTPDMRKQADEIEFTWRFNFTGAAGLVATPEATVR
ncbi:MAG TPA: TonB family protein [Burkholderiaceae bacterium]|jgi:protein TonB|nr:TonB family protein [Burkholderiaceae bacterium]